jgi:hypothetical protein
MIANALKKSSGLNYPGLIAAWSAKGKTNDDEDRAILKDLTGNGHDITLNGFAFSEMSGYGGYNINFKNYHKSNLIVNSIIESSRIILNPEDSDLYYVFTIYGTTEINSFTCSIKGIQEKGVLEYQYSNLTENKRDTVLIDSDGIYTIPKSDKVTITHQVGFKIKKKFINQIVIELLPEYPDALVFDGVDDYGINENMPILTDYTVIAKKYNFFDGIYRYFINKHISKSISGSMVFDRITTENKYQSLSFGSNYIGGDPNNKISWMSKNVYNQKNINSGTDLDGPIIHIGSNGTTSEFFKGAFYSAYLFDRSLDEQEIKEFIRKYIDPEYLLPSEIPTPDCYYDFSLGSNDDENRETIKDQSGNGNDAKAYNIAWADMSGYGGYSYNFNDWSKGTNVVFSNTDSKINIIESLLEKSSSLYLSNTSDKIDFYIKIEGITADTPLYFGDEIHGIQQLQNGINHIEITANENGYYGFRAFFVGECNITIELIPQYPGALVLDGTDDYIALESFDSGFKTVFMAFKPMTTMNTGFYDQIKKGEKNYCFAICGSSTDIAFTYRNTNGKSYINGKLNTSVLSKDIINKTVCIGIVNENVTPDNTISPKIGNGTHYEPWYANMVIYKFLGFKEELTEEQIKAIIKKYNLLDGVDEIEVS